MTISSLPGITDFAGMEFAPFKLKQGIAEEALFAAVEQMVNGLYEGDPRFLGHAVLKGEGGSYVDVVFATSAQGARELCGKWGTGPFATQCLAYLEKIEEDSSSIGFYQRVR